MHHVPDSAANEDRRCIECDYALRGLPDQGRCPECGTAYERDTIVVDSPIRYGQHPWVIVPIYLGVATVAWFSGCGIVSLPLVIVCLGMLAQSLLAAHRRGRTSTRARCVFTRDGLTQGTPLGTTTVTNWNAVGFCILERATLVRWRRKPFHRSYRIRLSRSRHPFVWRGFMVDAWFDATREQVDAIAQLISTSLRADARTRIRIQPDIAPQRDGTSFGQFR